MPKTAYSLPPRWVVAVGVTLFAIATALPWTWLVNNRPPTLDPVVRRLARRPALRILPPGKFAMGSHEEEAGRSFNTEKLHAVEITVPFALATTEVTQGQYQSVMGKNPSRFKGDLNRPVDNVSWQNTVEYCNNLSRLEGLSVCYDSDGELVERPQGLRCTGYRLPTEAEWEYAARADGQTLYAGSDEAKEVAWFADNAMGTTHAVGQKMPNAWGLYDMSGNVSEWVWDRWTGDLGSAAAQDPVSHADSLSNVVRGGSFDRPAQLVRVAGRNAGVRIWHDAYQGFRVARSYP